MGIWSEETTDEETSQSLGLNLVTTLRGRADTVISASSENTRSGSPLSLPTREIQRWSSMDHNDFLTCVSCYMVHPEKESHPRQAVDREAPAAAGRVLPSEAEHDPPAGDRGREPVLAEHALPVGGAGVRPRGGAQGGGLRGHQGGQNGQVPPAQVRGGPARPSQRHQEVGLIRSHGFTGRPPTS
ncbi:uncharacterized protein [Vulpes vulpes]